MYNQSRDRMLATRASNKKPIIETFVDRPRPGAVNTAWRGRYTPKVISRERGPVMLADDGTESFVPLVPREDFTLPSVGITPTVSAPSGPSFWDGLFSGLGKIVAPAAQAIVGIKAQGAVSQAQQQTMASTWNAGITGPALQAQAYQNAYLSGSGSAPLGTTTMMMLGLGALGLVLVLSRK